MLSDPLVLRRQGGDNASFAILQEQTGLGARTLPELSFIEYAIVVEVENC